MKYKFTEEDYRLAIDNSLSIADVCRNLGIVAIGGNYKTVRNNINKFNIDISHFTGSGWNVGEKYKYIGKRYKLEDILIVDSTYTNTNRLRLRLINEGFKEHECECCGLKEWMGKLIPLEVDHVNGNNTDNRIENLRILCPNCHAQTSTYRGKNIK